MLPIGAVALLLLVEQSSPRAALRSQATRGPFGVGFRVESVRDRSRTLGPATDFEGRRHTAPREWPVQLAVWYPSRDASGPGIRDGAYRAWHGVRETLAPPGPQDEQQAARDLLALTAATRIPASSEDVQAALDTRGMAVADAPAAPGRYPLIVGGLGGAGVAWPLAELLASHGYVVVTTPALGRTAGDEATRPQVALETRARTLEFAAAHVLETREVDADRIALIGVNFDGAAALLSQARTMRARAVVSIDGREGKAGGDALLRQAPEFDIVRLRTPYLTVQWDEPMLPAPDPTLFEQMAYAPRRWLVFRGLGHAQLVANVAPLPSLPAQQREAIVVLQQTVLGFLDTHVRGTASSPPPIAQALLVADRHLEALPSAPTRDELEDLLWTKADVVRGLEIVRRAQARHPGTVLLDAQTARLYAFRHERAGRVDAAAALRRYAEEVASPR